MLSNFILQFLNNQRNNVDYIDDLDINDIKPIDIQIYEEDNCILAEDVAALFSHPRGFDTGHTLRFDKLNSYEQHSFLNQVFTAKESTSTNIIETAQNVHLAYCHMWLYYRIKFGIYISEECIRDWNQLDVMRKREYVFIALAINASHNQETEDVSEKLLEETCDILLNEH
jgi:hypothetical protein